jgi:hypothetical protein
MTKKWRITYTFLLSIFFTLIILGFSNHRAEATTVMPDYYIQMDSTKLKGDNPETDIYELKKDYVYVYATADGWTTPSNVTWSSSETGVVTLEDTTTPNCKKIRRNGPGYSIITATITQGEFSCTKRFTVFVNLEIDHQNTGTILATITNTRILVLDNIGQQKRAIVKYIDYTAEGASTVTGSVISTDSLSFESDNTGVVSVDKLGYIKAEGAGCATITVTSTTMSSKDKALTATLRVTVRPKFSFTYSTINDSGDPVDITRDSAVNDDGTTGNYTGVPPSIVLNTNAIKASNLVWVIYNVVNGKRTEVLPTSKLMTYKINASNTVTISGIKAGTYEIYAFVHKDYDEEAKAPYAYMKISVPIALKSQVIYMNVGDTYNLMENSNITSKDMYGAYLLFIKYCIF